MSIRVFMGGDELDVILNSVKVEAKIMNILNITSLYLNIPIKNASTFSLFP